MSADQQDGDCCLVERLLDGSPPFCPAAISASDHTLIPPYRWRGAAILRRSWLHLASAWL